MKHLFKALTLNSSGRKAEQDVNEMLEKELTKPYQKRDYDKIEALLEEYTVQNGLEDQLKQATETGIQKAIAQTKKRKSKIKKYRGILVSVCLIAILATANVISVVAADKDIFSVIVNFAKTNFSVDFFSSEVSSEIVLQIPTSNDDPYGMIAKCAENGIYPETPHYLPEGYVLTLCKYTDMPQFLHGMKFTFKNQNNEDEYICFTYDLYEDVKQMAYTKYPNIEHNLTEIEINGKPAILAEEKKDNQTRIVYHIDNLLVSIFIQGMSNDKINDIINSIY